MENSRQESNLIRGFEPIQKSESGSEIILDKETVNYYYSKAKARNPVDQNDRQRRYTTKKTDNLFYEGSLELIRDNFETLTDQLLDSLHNVDRGGDVWTEVAKNKDGIAWTEDPKDVEHFVALASALEVGEFVTTYVFLRHCSTKERGIFRYVINKEKHRILHPKHKD